MADKVAARLKKLPVPPLPVTAYTAERAKPRKPEEEVKARRRETCLARDKTRIRIGRAITQWRQLKDRRGFQTDADLASFLLDSYFQANPQKNGPKPSSSKIILSSTTSENVPRQQQSAGSSPTKLRTGSVSVSSVQSPEDETLKDPNQDVCQRAQKQHNWTENRPVENKENGGTEAEDDHSRSVCVSGGHYVVDLESSSQLIVDEECIEELFKKCLECNRQCRVTKRVDGLRLVMYQSCYFCHYQYKWSNQPEMDEEDVLRTGAAQ